MQAAMNWEMPSAADFWEAVEIYLAVAYESAPPAPVKSRIDALRATPTGALFRSPGFERTPKDAPTRLAVRLGNPWYPHMKLVIEKAPASHAPLFRADTHDCHIQLDPASKEYHAFREMTAKNQALASKIEAAWEEAGLTTFKSFLREDLARRQAEYRV